MLDLDGGETHRKAVGKGWACMSLGLFVIPMKMGLSLALKLTLLNLGLNLARELGMLSPAMILVFNHFQTNV